MLYQEEPQRIHKIACQMVERGISIIPTGGGISPKAKQPHHEALKATGHGYINKEGKERSTWKAFQTRLPTREELDAWYLEHGARGLGFVTGEISDYIVVDVDTEGLPLLETLDWIPHVITPSGGRHFYVQHPSWRVANNASKAAATLPPGFDVRGDGGYAMFPPSRNRQGNYRRTDHRKPLSIADIPEVVDVDGQRYELRKALGLIQPAAPAPAPKVQRPRYYSYDEQVPVWLIMEKALEYAPESRNKGAFMFGLFMNANNYTEAEALRHVAEYTAQAHDMRSGEFTLQEAENSVRSAYRYPKNAPWKRERN